MENDKPNLDFRPNLESSLQYENFGPGSSAYGQGTYPLNLPSEAATPMNETGKMTYAGPGIDSNDVSKNNTVISRNGLKYSSQGQLKSKGGGDISEHITKYHINNLNAQMSEINSKLDEHKKDQNNHINTFSQ